MEFCQRCGSMILVMKDKAVCVNCGYKPKKKPKIEASEKLLKKESVAVVKDDQDIINPIVEITCPRCKNRKAYFWTNQTRAADESETKFYKCTKCRHTWRVYR